MFTLEQIAAAHSVVKSGADFPAYVQALIALGVRRYDVFVVDGHAEYVGGEDAVLQSEPIYAPLQVATMGDAAAFRADLARHQAGGSDYFTFCQDAARAGVERWRVDMEAMTCAYLDSSGQALLVEQIPHA